MPESSCKKKTSVHNKNMCINQLYSYKISNFATAYPVRNLFGTFEFEKRAPDPSVKQYPEFRQVYI